jgi:hypothetical protein
MTTQATPHAVQFETAKLEASASFGTELEPREMRIGAEAAALLGFPSTHGPVTVGSKTLTFQGKLFVGGTQAATLDDATVTVTREANPSTGAPFLFITFQYLMTSLGWRSGRGAPTGEPLGMTQGLYFLNQAGGTMYSWGFPYDDLVVQCGWNREPRYHVIRDYDFVDWFDLWAGVQHRVQGAMYRC